MVLLFTKEYRHNGDTETYPVGRIERRREKDAPDTLIYVAKKVRADGRADTVHSDTDEDAARRALMFALKATELREK